MIRPETLQLEAEIFARMSRYLNGADKTIAMIRALMHLAAARQDYVCQPPACGSYRQELGR